MRFWIFFCFAISSLFSREDIGVTYEFSGGRFGDNLLTYLHAKWFAMQKGIPLLYKSFQYSSQLTMHQREVNFLTYDTGPRLRYYLAHPHYDINTVTLPLLYICPYFPEDPWELEETYNGSGERYYRFEVDWKDETFRKTALEMITPLYPLTIQHPPKDKISIAVHVREGGGFDDQIDIANGCIAWPLKIPPLHFYIDGLKACFEQYPGKEFYCYVFTDAQSPSELVERIRSEIPPHVKVKFDCRRGANSYLRNVLEDFYSLFEFDLLVRPQSNFSFVPSLLHDFAAVYSPAEFVLMGNRVEITKAEFKVHDPYLAK